MTAATIPTFDTLMEVWRTSTVRHATAIHDAARAHLDYAAYEADGIIAEHITTASGYAPTTGPWVRVYDPEFRGPGDHGRWVWVAGRTVIPDSQVVAVGYYRDGMWSDLAELNKQWPARPCPGSFDTWNMSALDDTPHEREQLAAGTTYCGECERIVPVNIADGENVTVHPHDISGAVLTDALAAAGLQ